MSAPSEPSGPLVTIDEIRAAATRIAPIARRTPLLPSPWEGLFLKAENLQPIGAFKIRGAVNAIAQLPPAVRARGVVTHSSGNHAQAVAYAARSFGVPARIVIPRNAPPRKIDATRALGAVVELVEPADRLARAEEIATTLGMTMVPPFDDPAVIAGQGTIGLELAADVAAWPEQPSAVLVPISGGGLISGIAAALAALLPDTAVIGVEPEWAGDAAESFRCGERTAWPLERTGRTVADGLRVPCVGELPWQHIHRFVDDVITVTEDEILRTVRDLVLDARLVAEPSGAVSVAAHRDHADQLPAGRHLAVVSGGNIDPALLSDILTQQHFPTE